MAIKFSYIHQPQTLEFEGYLYNPWPRCVKSSYLMLSTSKQSKRELFDKNPKKLYSCSKLQQITTDDQHNNLQIEQRKPMTKQRKDYDFIS